VIRVFNPGCLLARDSPVQGIHQMVQRLSGGGFGNLGTLAEWLWRVRPLGHD
jgi:hypothetical protein